MLFDIERSVHIETNSQMKLTALMERPTVNGIGGSPNVCCIRYDLILKLDSSSLKMPVWPCNIPPKWSFAEKSIHIDHNT